MPVLGHAFVGLAIATWTRPNTQLESSSQPSALGKALWTPLMVGLSYGPDILAQCGQFALGRDLRQITHAALTAALLALAIAPVLARCCDQPCGRSFLVVCACLLLHDVLDLLQTTDRTFCWPFSSRALGPPEPLIPSDPRQEALFFAAVYCLTLIVYWGQERLHSKDQPLFSFAPGRHSSLSWLSVAVTTILMLVAAITHQLRQVREDQLELARRLSQEQHAYQAALTILDQAERWPSAAKQGRIDYLRAWTYEQLRNREQAERYYLRSYQADPTYFWTIADFVMFYASSNQSAVERRRLIAPYLRYLQDEFSGHHELPAVLNRIEERLAQ